MQYGAMKRNRKKPSKVEFESSASASSATSAPDVYSTLCSASDLKLTLCWSDAMQVSAAPVLLSVKVKIAGQYTGRCSVNASA